MKKALLVTSYTALNGFKSGATLRTNSIVKLLEKCGYQVQIISIRELNEMSEQKYKLIAITPFTSIRALKKAKRMSSFIWFDACDSWRSTRISRFFHGEPLQLLALVRDLFYLSKLKDVQIISFISKADQVKHLNFIKKGSFNNLVIPNVAPDSCILEDHGRRLVFIGDGSYGPNRRALRFLRRILEYLPESYKIDVIGKNFKSNDSRVVLHGYSEETLLYGSLDIQLAPVFSGAGINNKVFYPLTLGLPVVTTKFGSAGFSSVPNLIIAETAEDFASSIIDLEKKRGVIQLNKRVLLCDQTDELFKILS